MNKKQETLFLPILCTFNPVFQFSYINSFTISLSSISFIPSRFYIYYISVNCWRKNFPRKILGKNIQKDVVGWSWGCLIILSTNEIYKFCSKAYYKSPGKLFVNVWVFFLYKTWIRYIYIYMYLVSVYRCGIDSGVRGIGIIYTSILGIYEELYII